MVVHQIVARGRRKSIIVSVGRSSGNGGSIPPSETGLIAQWLELGSNKARVAGSIPAWTNLHRWESG